MPFPELWQHTGAHTKLQSQLPAARDTRGKSRSIGTAVVLVKTAATPSTVVIANLKHIIVRVTVTGVELSPSLWQLRFRDSSLGLCRSTVTIVGVKRWLGFVKICETTAVHGTHIEHG